MASPNAPETAASFETLALQEEEFIKSYLYANRKNLAEKYSLTLTPSRMDIVAAYYAKNIMDIGSVIKKIKSYYDDIKKIELYFFKNHDINIVLEEDAIDYIIENMIHSTIDLDQIYKKISTDFEHGLKLAREKTGRNRFFINRKGLLDGESYVADLIKEDLSSSS